MNQQQIWDNIAEEWNKFKTKPAEHVFEFLKEKKGKILDLGSGSGRHLKKRAKEKKIDAEFLVSDISKEKLPFEDNFFDSAIAIAVFHCLKQEVQKNAVKEFFRVLKPGAEAEIAVWNKNARCFKNTGKEKFVKWRDKGARYYYLF